jgi:hypothetical protein
MKNYWLSIVVLGVLAVGGVVLVESQGSSRWERQQAASESAFNRHLRTVEVQSARAAARQSAADNAFQRAATRQDARLDRQAKALAASAGEGGTSAKSSVVPDPSPTTHSPTTTRRLSTTPQAVSNGTAARHSSPLATGGGGPTQLTVAQVEAAEWGALAMLKLCLYQARGSYAAEKAEIPAAVRGQHALERALQQDPDTRYRNFPGGPPTTMREQAALVASPMNLASGGACSQEAQNIDTALNGLPG